MSGELFRFHEVPDPEGLLEDLLGELVDNSALQPVTTADLVAALTPNYEAAARTFAIQAGWTWHDVVNNDPGPRAAEAARAIVDAALGIHPQDEGDER